MSILNLDKEIIKSKLPIRPQSANKGTFGKVLVIAGSINYPGSAYLTSVAATRVGAGLVTLAVPKVIYSEMVKKVTEVTLIPLEDTNGYINNEALFVVQDKILDYDVLIIGPGIGQNDSTIKFVDELFKYIKNMNNLKVVIDADGLNILSKNENSRITHPIRKLANYKVRSFLADRNNTWWKNLSQGYILTPHPGEMARLTGMTINEIQQKRVEVSKNFAKLWNKIIVLKGAKTVIASPDGNVVISPFASPVLATAGTGDVLTGCIGGFLAQGLSQFDASIVGVYIHALAGEKVKAKLGDTGVLASDLLPYLPLAIKETKS